MGVDFLSAADDLLTSALLDRIIFAQDGRQTGKMNKKTAPTIAQADIDVLNILVNKLREGEVEERDAVDRFCQTQCAIEFMLRWKSLENAFRIHVRRYMVALSFYSGLAFHETNRYTQPLVAAYPTPSPTPSTSSTPVPLTPAIPAAAPPPFIDVAVFSTRFFKKGETIELRGGTAKLSDEQDDQLRADGNKVDFSVIWSERDKCFALLLGPARFVNHDCRSNVEFIHSGKNMLFKVMEDIQPNEQLFTDYGNNYFEDNNAACLCSTCEQFGRGAFKPSVIASHSTLPSAQLLQPLQPPIASTSALPIVSHISNTASGSGSASPHDPNDISSSSVAKIVAPATATSKGKGKKNRKKIASPASSRASSPQSTPDVRRSERSTIDLERLSKRIVHPALAPPVGYQHEYDWDMEARIATFIEASSSEDSSSSDSDDSDDSSSDDEGEEDKEKEEEERRGEKSRRLIPTSTARELRLTGQRTSKRLHDACEAIGGRWNYGDGEEDNKEDRADAAAELRRRKSFAALQQAKVMNGTAAVYPKRKSGWKGWVTRESGNDTNVAGEKREEECTVEDGARPKRRVKRSVMSS